MTNKLFIGMLCAMLFSACTQDDVLGVNEEIPTTKTLSVLSTQEAQIKFAKILSKAVASSESVNQRGQRAREVGLQQQTQQSD